MEIYRVASVLDMEPRDQEIIVEGWVRTKRDSKTVCFFELNDGSALRSLQIVIEKEQGISAEAEIPQITTGSSLRVKGTLRPSPGKNQKAELAAKDITVFGSAPPEYPLQKKRHSFEYLREIAHLRPRTNTLGAVARVRNTMSFAIHRYFQEKGFFNIHTPIITGSDCEGAGEMFQVTTLPIDKPPMSRGKVDFGQDFFGKPASLTVSGQLEAEIYALAMKNVYTFGPTFRAENSQTSRHLAEFWMIEPEMAFCDIKGNMDVAEEFLKYILEKVLIESSEDMNFFNTWIEKGIIEGLTSIIEKQFVRITYSEAIEVLKKADTDFEFPVEWGEDLQSEHERYLTEIIHKSPVIVTDYPKEIKAFYMKVNEDKKTVRAMDVLVPRLGEIIGGSERESDLHTLESRIDEMGLPKENYWWYLDLRRFGTVPHSGFGLGFERLIQYVTGMKNIRDVIPFPRFPHSAEF